MGQKDLWDSKWELLNENKSLSDFSEKFFSLMEEVSGEKLLELGCGVGNDVEFFLSKGLDVTCVDFSSVALEKLSDFIGESSNLKKVECDIRNIDFLNEYFDFIYANLSLHYFNDYETKEIFKDLFRILNKGGIIFVRCKSVSDSLYGKGELIEKDMYKYNGHVRHFFSEEYMRECFQEFEGLELESFDSEHLLVEGGVVISSFVEGVGRK